MEEDPLAIVMNSISDVEQTVVGSFIPIGNIISENTSKDIVEYLFTMRIKEQGDKRKYYFFPMGYPDTNILLARFTVVCDEYIVGIVIYNLPSLTVYKQWKYTDLIEKNNNHVTTGQDLDYDIIRRLLDNNKNPDFYMQVLNMFKYLYNLGYWTYGAFSEYEYEEMTKFDGNYILIFGPQEGIRLEMNVNGEARVKRGRLTDKHREDLKRIGVKIL